MLKAIIADLAAGKDMTGEQAAYAAEKILGGETNEIQTGAFLTALAIKGETSDEIAAFAKVMRQNAVKPDIPDNCLDIVGTGGDKSGTFNISTCAAFIAAACGVKVAKHGNGSVSSKCGAADVLDELKVNTKADPAVTAAAFKSCGAAFLHAQVYHPAMRFVANVRKQLGLRTIFNILGPLANPAKAKYQVLGVYSPDLVEPLCRALASLGCERVVAVNGGGCDEVSAFSSTLCCEYSDGAFKTYELNPEDFGIKPCKKQDILGGDCARNAEIFNSVMRGESGAYLGASVINAAVCLKIYGVEPDLKKAADRAFEAVYSGRAREVFESYRAAVAK